MTHETLDGILAALGLDLDGAVERGAKALVAMYPEDTEPGAYRPEARAVLEAALTADGGK